VSAETDFRALLLAYPGLAALVGTRISENAVPQGTPLPYVAFAARHERTHNLLGELMADRAEFTTQCWGRNAAEAAAVAAQVTLAVQAADPARGAVVLSTESAYDPATESDATILTVEWWAL
jgi:hypothetical protein